MCALHSSCKAEGFSGVGVVHELAGSRSKQVTQFRPLKLWLPFD